MYLYQTYAYGMNSESSEPSGRIDRSVERGTPTRRVVLAAGEGVVLEGLAGCSASEDGNGTDSSTSAVTTTSVPGGKGSD